MLGFASSLHRETVTVAAVVQGAPDASGVPVATPAAPVALQGCNVQGQATTQDTDGGLRAVTSYRVSAPGVGHNVAAGAPVTWRLPGAWFVDGDPIEFTATGALDHTEFVISRVSGG